MQLLIRFLRPGRELLRRPLALVFLEAEQQGPPQNLEGFRAVGDNALFVVGLYPDSLERSLIGPDYYVDLGRSAYQRAADSGREGVREMFGELSGSFPDLVRILAQISTSDLFQSERDTIRLYRRWLLTRSDVDAAELTRRGVILTEPSSARH